MRPSWGLLLSALLAFGLGGGRALALDFHDPISGWSMTLPPGWTPMAEDEKAGIVEALKGEGVRRVNLVTAFRLSDADLPYLLATEHHVKNASLERVAKWTEAAHAKVDPAAVQFGAPAIHEAMKMVLIESRGEELQSLVALFPGRDVVVELTVVLATDAPESDFATFRAITSSVRFDAGRGYAPKSDAFPDSMTKLLLLCCGIVAIRLVLAKRRNERGRPSDRLEAEGSPERP